MPVEINADRWVGRDLFLDLWQPAGGEARWLDEDELAAAVESGLVDASTSKRIRNERSLIDLQVSQSDWPPPIVRDLSLEQARALKEPL
jgi:predicted RNA-binding protein associated with RNAse of E/G family